MERRLRLNNSWLPNFLSNILLTRIVKSLPTTSLTAIHRNKNRYNLCRPWFTINCKPHKMVSNQIYHNCSFAKLGKNGMIIVNSFFFFYLLCKLSFLICWSNSQAIISKAQSSPRTMGKMGDSKRRAASTSNLWWPTWLWAWTYGMLFFLTLNHHVNSQKNLTSWEDSSSN